MSESEKLRLLESVAAIAEEIWLTAEPLAEAFNGDRLISQDTYDRLYLVLEELDMTEQAENYMQKNNWDSCLTKSAAVQQFHNNLSPEPGKPQLRRDVRLATGGLDGATGIRATTGQKLRQLRLLAQQDLCPAWAVIAVAKKAVELDRAKVPQEEIDIARLLDETIPNWREIRDYLKKKRIPIFEQESCSRNRVLLALGYYGGLSASEICRIKWQDIDFENNIIRVSGRGGAIRVVETDDFLLMPLLTFGLRELNNGRRKEDGYVLLTSNGKSLDRTVAHRIVKNAAQKAEIVQTISLKTLRNSHGMNLFNQGKSIKHIQERLGVKNFKALFCESAGKIWS